MTIATIQRPARIRNIAPLDHPTQNGTGNGYTCPPLESGDHLTRAEFERRYNAHPDIKKAELIEGVVYVASPLRVKKHGQPHSHVIIWLGMYCATTLGIEITDNSTLRLDIDNEPQPDISVWIDPKAGGKAFVDDDDYLRGSPELLVEIAASSAAIDVNDKLNAYRRNAVQEYLVVLPYEQKIRWFTWQEGEYLEMQADGQGLLRSQVLPGLVLDPVRFWAKDLVGLLAVLQEGLNSPEHGEFVTQLQQRLQS